MQRNNVTVFLGTEKLPKDLQVQLAQHLAKKTGSGSFSYQYVEGLWCFLAYNRTTDVWLAYHCQGSYAFAITRTVDISGLVDKFIMGSQ